jgi:hypothetical protein
LIGIEVLLDPLQYICRQVLGGGVEERAGSIGEEESKAATRAAALLPGELA